MAQQANLEIKTGVEELLQDQDTKGWHDSLESETTRINYPKHLVEYLLYRNLSIKQMIKNFKADPVLESKRLQDFVNVQLKKLAPGSVANYVSALQNRLEYDGISLVKRIRIPNRHIHPTITEETIPTKEQILSFLSHANVRAQAIIALISFLGVRFHVIAGLKLADFPELKIENREIKFEKVPTMVKIRGELSKNKLPYQTFLIEFGCRILKNYLEFRMREGETLTSDSLVIPTDSQYDSLKKKASIIARAVDRVFEKLGNTSRPYSLKDFFATALLNSGIQQNHQTFFMGHKGPMQLTYSLRRQLPKEQIEQLRILFKEKIEPHLIPVENSGESVVKAAFKKLAQEMGLEVKDEAPMSDTISEIAKVYSAAKADLAKRTNTTKQKTINETELDKFLEEGWEYVSTLPSGNLIVRSVIP
ncbi:MAG: hypothetical protein ACRD9Q_00780 [Nitrososphaeraceae archaeon]